MSMKEKINLYMSIGFEWSGFWVLGWWFLSDRVCPERHILIRYWIKTLRSRHWSILSSVTLYLCACRTFKNFWTFKNQRCQRKTGANCTGTHSGIYGKNPKTLQVKLEGGRRRMWKKVNQWNNKIAWRHPFISVRNPDPPEAGQNITKCFMLYPSLKNIAI